MTPEPPTSALPFHWVDHNSKSTIYAWLGRDSDHFDLRFYFIENICPPILSWQLLDDSEIANPPRKPAAKLMIEMSISRRNAELFRAWTWFVGCVIFCPIN